MRQRAAHHEAIAEIAGARHDDEVERVAGLGIAEHGIVGGLPAHFPALSSFAASLACIIRCVLPTLPGG